MRGFAAFALAGALGGCAMRGPMVFECAQFAPLELQSTILDDAVGASLATLASDSEDQGAFARALARSFKGGAEDGAVLLLSGGGQWGAFGAGYLSAYAAIRPLPDFRAITGVSTGALQAMFLAPDTPDLDERLDRLVAEYAIERESDVVERNAPWKTLFLGSRAGIAPLRAKVENALCATPDDDMTQCLIDDIAASNKAVFVGIVEAASGRFKVVDIVRLARHIDTQPPDPLKTRAQARECVAGAVIASSAMPVSFQPVAIRTNAADRATVYFDGGVRSSVFFPSIAAGLKSAAKDMKGVEKERIEAAPIYVIRNGPTILPPYRQGEPDPNPPGDALSAVERGQAILVNELEVRSITGLRLIDGNRKLLLVSANGYDTGLYGGPCTRPEDGSFFDKEFMKCLASVGRGKAAREKPWTCLPTVAEITGKNDGMRAAGVSGTIAGGGRSGEPTCGQDDTD